MVALALLDPISVLLCRIAPKTASSSEQAGQCTETTVEGWKILESNALELGLAAVLISILK